MIHLTPPPPNSSPFHPTTQLPIFPSLALYFLYVLLFLLQGGTYLNKGKRARERVGWWWYSGAGGCGAGGGHEGGNRGDNKGRNKRPFVAQIPQCIPLKAVFDKLLYTAWMLIYRACACRVCVGVRRWSTCQAHTLHWTANEGKMVEKPFKWGVTTQ